MKDNNESKAQRGKKVQIPAETWNGFVAASRHHKRHEKFVPHRSANDRYIPSDLIRSNNEVMVENATAYDFSYAFHIVQINGTIINHAADPIDNNRRIGVVGLIPLSKDAPCAIVQVPLEIGDIGRAVTSGNSTVKVLMSDLTHQWANPTVGEHAYMTSDTHGQARILWHGPTGDTAEAAAGIRLAIVNLISGQSAETTNYGDGIAGNIAGCLKIEPVARYGESDAPTTIIRMLSWDDTTESWLSDDDYGDYGQVQFWIEEGRHRLVIGDTELFRIGFDRIKRLLFSGPHPDGDCPDYYVVAISCANCAGDSGRFPIGGGGPPVQVEPGNPITITIPVSEILIDVPPSSVQIDIDAPEGLTPIKIILTDPIGNDFILIDHPVNNSPIISIIIDPINGIAVPNIGVPLFGQIIPPDNFNLFVGNPNGNWQMQIINDGALPINVPQFQINFGDMPPDAQFVVVNEETNDLQFQLIPEVDAPVWQYQVDWGDGNVEWLQFQVDEEPVIQHQYTVDGVYDVVLRAYGRNNAYDEYTTQAIVPYPGTACVDAIELGTAITYGPYNWPELGEEHWFHFAVANGVWDVTVLAGAVNPLAVDSITDASCGGGQTTTSAVTNGTTPVTATGGFGIWMRVGNVTTDPGTYTIRIDP